MADLNGSFMDSSELSTRISSSDLPGVVFSSVDDAVAELPAADQNEGQTDAQKRRRKKKTKKAKATDPVISSSTDSKADKAPGAAKEDSEADRERGSVLCISRNKHWKYISSYHGPWLQLPLELLESLLVLNLDPATLSDGRSASLPSTHTLSLSGTSASNPYSRLRDRGYHSLSSHNPPSSLQNSPNPFRPNIDTSSPQHPSPALPQPPPGKATPPPIDPGVFRNVAGIRRLIDEAAELSVRAASGLSAAALSSAGSLGLGLDGMGGLSGGGGGHVGGGRNVAMSAMRVHRLRALAVQKLAQAYKADEIASSVMVMQGGSVFDDVAERVLKHDPHDMDAKYVHFFHEKIPSRQLAESTTTKVLDDLIAAHPQRLEYYRTRGIVHCFRDEYAQATKDFTHALREARAARRAKMAHRNVTTPSESRGGKNKKKKKGRFKHNGHGTPNEMGSTGDETATVDGPDGEPLLMHPSVLPDAPEPIEPQLLFLRGAAYLQHAIFLIETVILQLEDVKKAPMLDGAELRLCYIENGRFGGVEIGNPDGPLGRADGVKAQAYRKVLAEPKFRDLICGLVKKSMKDHERFLAHFDTVEAPFPCSGDVAADLVRRIETAFLLTESIRPGNHASGGLGVLDDTLDAPPMIYTTYHPLLVESHFTILICQLMLADLPALLSTFARTSALIDGLEGYPVFLPPRSMSQAEFIEVLERLASGWRIGTQPHSLAVAVSARGKLAIEAPHRPPSANSTDDASSYDQLDPTTPSGSSSAICSETNGGSGSQTTTPGRVTPSGATDGVDLVEVLDCARILLAPVVKRQKERAVQAAQKTGSGFKNKKPLNISIPLHGPRVEIVLAWLAAVHLVELESVA